MRVFVALLNEGTEVWRPADAEPLGGDLYRLLGTVPDDESWQFLTRTNCSLRRQGVSRRDRPCCDQGFDKMTAVLRQH